MKKALSFLVPAVPLLLGMALLAGLAVAKKKASRADGWTQTLATVEKVDARPGGVELAYRYEVDGREHRNAAGTLTVRDGSEGAALLERYRPGRALLAYVNPANPAESLLELPEQPEPWPLLAGVLLLILGIALAIYSWRQRPRSVPAKPVRRHAAPMSRLRPPPSAPVKRPEPE